MPMKRSRTGSSSSCVERPIATAAAASVCSVKVMRTDAAAEASRPKFMTVASPVNVGESEKVKIGGFWNGVTIARSGLLRILKFSCIATSVHSAQQNAVIAR
ncbi:hypothetical protein DH2020_024794 [Rehmannia glutinosa]|uniref:Uncharacterized protein n=1 Tax=Rehmannia glutinosa TaxID=99300 RepID=A0ABR0W1E5_REHGL